MPRLDVRVVLDDGPVVQWAKHTKTFSDFASAGVIRAALDDLGDNL
jgi:hypothetical protein